MDLSVIATTVQFLPVQGAFTVSPPDLSLPTLTCVCHSLQNRLSSLLLSSLKHCPLTPCRPFPMLFKLGQSPKCSPHTPRHFLAISKSSISILLRSAPSSSFSSHHHKHNSLLQTIKSNQPVVSLQIYLSPPPTNQSIWVPPPCPVNERISPPSVLAALSRRRISLPTVLAALFRRRISLPTVRDAWLCK